MTGVLSIKKATQIYTETLASKGWQITKSEVNERVRHILTQYPGRKKNLLAHIVSKCAAHRAFSLDRSREAVAGWNQRVRAVDASERAALDEFNRNLERAASLIIRADLRAHERDAFFGILNCESDKDLEGQYPGTTRNQRDQWRTRARRKVVALAPELRPWLKFHKNRLRKLPGRGIKPVSSIDQLSRAVYLGVPEQC
tara:strand:- start:961 stop:1557 length:597 start_codon:yes stop_codon:yes gene_type:complete